MRARSEETLHEIVFVGFGPDNAFSAAFLAAVFCDGRALHETVVGNGDHTAFVGDHVFHAKFARSTDEFGSAWFGVFFLQRQQLCFNDGEQLVFAFQNTTQFLDLFKQLEIFSFDLIALEAGQLIETQFQDCVGLAFRKRIFRHQLLFRFFAPGGAANDADEVVEIIESDFVAFENMCTVFRFTEAELGATCDDVATVIDEAFDQLFNIHLLRPLLVEGQQRYAERRFERGFLIKLIDDNARLLAAFQLDDDTSIFIRLVAHITDAFDFFFGDEFSDAGNEIGAVNVIRNFRDDDLLLAGLGFFGVGFAADAHDPFAGAQITFDAFAACDRAASREVRTGDKLYDLVDRDIGLIDDRAGSTDDFAQIMRRNIRRHTDRDAGRTVHQQVR